jgi:hypothetical protein
MPALRFDRYPEWGAVTIRAVWHLAARVVRIRRVFFYETDLTQPLATATASTPLDIRVGTATDIETFARDLTAAGLSVDDAHQRLQRGEVPIIAVSDGQLAHIHWLVLAGPVVLGELGLTLHLGPGEAYNSRAVTLPGWRGKGIHPAVSCFINRYERSGGFTRDLFYVWAHNAANLRVVVGKLHRRRTKTLWVVWLLGTGRPWTFGRTRHGAPRLGRAAASSTSGALDRVPRGAGAAD